MARSVRPAILYRVLGTALLLVALVGFYRGWCQISEDVLVVLTFHGVVDQPTQPWEVTFATLEESLRRLQRHGYVPIAPGEFQAWWHGSLPPGRRFLVTFDDGLSSSGQAIARLAREQGIRCLWFIVTDLLGRPGYATPEELRRLASDTGCVFGFHGKTHEEFPKVLEQGRDLAAEIRVGKATLETLTGNLVEFFAYPYGVYSTATRDLVASSGLRFGFTVEPWAVQRGEDDPFLLPRLMFLRGNEEFGDWTPPRQARTGGLTLTLAMFVVLLSLRMFVRAWETDRGARVAAGGTDC